jgi:hypothetical protein
VQVHHEKVRRKGEVTFLCETIRNGFGLIISPHHSWIGPWFLPGLQMVFYSIAALIVYHPV